MPGPPRLRSTFGSKEPGINPLHAVDIARNAAATHAAPPRPPPKPAGASRGTHLASLMHSVSATPSTPTPKRAASKVADESNDDESSEEEIEAEPEDFADLDVSSVRARFVSLLAVHVDDGEAALKKEAMMKRTGDEIKIFIDNNTKFMEDVITKNVDLLKLETLHHRNHEALKTLVHDLVMVQLTDTTQGISVPHALKVARNILLARSITGKQVDTAVDVENVANDSGFLGKAKDAVATRMSEKPHRVAHTSEDTSEDDRVIIRDSAAEAIQASLSKTNSISPGREKHGTSLGTAIRGARKLHGINAMFAGIEGFTKIQSINDVPTYIKANADKIENAVGEMVKDLATGKSDSMVQKINQYILTSLHNGHYVSIKEAIDAASAFLASEITTEKLQNAVAAASTRFKELMAKIADQGAEIETLTEQVNTGTHNGESMGDNMGAMSDMLNDINTKYKKTMTGMRQFKTDAEFEMDLLIEMLNTMIITLKGVSDIGTERDAELNAELATLTDSIKALAPETTT